MLDLFRRKPKISIGVVFATTGGPKIERAIRSFRRMESDIPIHVILDVSSNTFRDGGAANAFLMNSLSYRPNVTVKSIENHSHINGNLNAGMRWMKELGHTHVCLFHDDLIFSSLPANQGYFSRWFACVAKEKRLQESSGLGFGDLETFFKNPGTVRHQAGEWHCPPQVWDSMDLESMEFWTQLCPDGKPVRETEFPTFFVDYCEPGRPLESRCARLGPTGQIVPISAWEIVGGFDEEFGIHYDGDYPAACAVKKLSPILCLPDTPMLHLHNQSIGYRDPSIGIWGDFNGAFKRKYRAEVGDFWNYHLNGEDLHFGGSIL